MPRPVAPPEPADITVTSATQSEAALRQEMGVDEPAAADAKPKVEEKPAVEAKPPAAEAVAAAEADSTKPDAEVSEAARALRSNRFDERNKKIQDEIDLLTDTITRLGGSAPAIEKREYPNKQAQLDHLTRIRHDANTALNKLLKDRPAPAAAAPVSRPVATKPAEPVADKKFSFETWEQYQEAHPGADFVEYTDARTDARYAFNEQQTAAKAEAKRLEDEAARADQERATRMRQANAAAAAFKVDHPDYDAVVGSVRLTEGVDYVDDERGTRVYSAQFKDLQEALGEAGEQAPVVLYYLGQHPDQVRALLSAPNPKALDRIYGRIEAAALAHVATPAASAGGEKPVVPEPVTAKTEEKPPPVAKPTSKAPAPVEEPQGGAQRTRSLEQLGNDSEENADAFIEGFQRTHGKRRG